MAQALDNAVRTFVHESPYHAEAWDDAATLTAIGIEIAQTVRESVRKIDRMSNCSVMKPSGYGELRITAKELIDHICDGMAGSIKGEEVIRAAAMNELEDGYPFFAGEPSRMEAA